MRSVPAEGFSHVYFSPPFFRHAWQCPIHPVILWLCEQQTLRSLITLLSTCPNGKHHSNPKCQVVQCFPEHWTPAGTTFDLTWLCWQQTPPLSSLEGQAERVLLTYSFPRPLEMCKKRWPGVFLLHINFISLNSHSTAKVRAGNSDTHLAQLLSAGAKVRAALGTLPLCFSLSVLEWLWQLH